MTIKPTASSERMKALMRKHTASAVATMSAPEPIPASQPLPVAVAEVAIPSARPPTQPDIPKGSWNRITIRLTAGELEKINDVVIATQQANRLGRVTTTDILRVALRRVKDQEAIDAREIKTLRAQDGRLAKAPKVKQS